MYTYIYITSDIYIYRYIPYVCIYIFIFSYALHIVGQTIIIRRSYMLYVVYVVHIGPWRDHVKDPAENAEKLSSEKPCPRLSRIPLEAWGVRGSARMPSSACRQG